MDHQPAALVAAGSAFTRRKPPTITSSPAEHLTLTFGKQPMRIAIVGGEPLFVGRDLCAALQLPMGPKITAAKYLRAISGGKRRYLTLATEKGPQPLIVVSALEAIALTCRRRRRVDGQVRAWVQGTDRDLTAAGEASKLAVGDALAAPLPTLDRPAPESPLGSPE